MDRVTVVTVCYNAENEIEATMRSVCEQDYLDVEYLIIDGDSKDRTVEIANRIKGEFTDAENIHMMIISEKDKGIYDAMNKGIDRATGEWILFLNAGDLFYDSRTISKVFDKDYGADVDGVFGDTLRYYNDWSKRVEGKRLEEIAAGLPLPFCHQSVFVKTRIMKELMFDDTYNLAGDYDFFVRCYLRKCKFLHIDTIVARYAMGGVSETNTVNHLKEKINIRQTNGLEEYSRIKKWYMISRLSCRQKLKKILPRRIVKMIRGF